ncbi:unnamed protein product [Urochloa humidicola]
MAGVRRIDFSSLSPSPNPIEMLRMLSGLPPAPPQAPPTMTGPRGGGAAVQDVQQEEEERRWQGGAAASNAGCQLAASNAAVGDRLRPWGVVALCGPAFGCSVVNDDAGAGRSSDERARR